jgi:hypothetical protein
MVGGGFIERMGKIMHFWVIPQSNKEHKKYIYNMTADTG